MSTEISSNLIIPFGKYKGKDVTQLIEDQQYLQWCKNQPWFKEKYANIYNIVVNQTIVKPSSGDKTPEHNRIQNLFLDKSLCNSIFEKTWKSIFEMTGKSIFEMTGKSDRYNYDSLRINIEFEGEFNWDIILKSGKVIRLIEIKPILGDDYPNVLRKMKSQDKLYRSEHRNCLEQYGYPERCKSVLIIDKFDSSYTTEDMLVDIFDQAGIAIIFLRDIVTRPNSTLSFAEENKLLKQYLSSLEIDYHQILNAPASD
jgi:uncharacterized protein (DUF3820 family)